MIGAFNEVSIALPVHQRIGDEPNDFKFKTMLSRLKTLGLIFMFVFVAIETFYELMMVA